MRNLFVSDGLPTLGCVVRRYTADELVGAKEIADRLGVGTSIVHDWRRRHDRFPPPIARLSMGFVWAWSDVESWARATRRLSEP